MNENNLDAELAAANPVDEARVGTAVPPGAGELMLREIARSRPLPLGRRMIGSVAGLRAPAWGRIGFVGAVASVVVAFLALNLTSLQSVNDAAVTDQAGQVSDAARCEASGPTADAARQAFESACPQTDPDCAPIDDGWRCVSQQVDQPRPVLEADVEPDVSGAPEPGDPDETSAAAESSTVEARSSATGTADADTATSSTGDAAAQDPDAVSDAEPDSNAGGDEQPASGTDPETAGPGSNGDRCSASGDSLTAAMAAYQQQCGQPRVDCDPADDRWICSNGQIGRDRPETDPAPAPATGGCIVIEAETLELTGAWKRVEDEQASGGAYITWEGLSPEANNWSPADVITIAIDVPEAGGYRLIWSMRQPTGVAGGKANDSWLNFPDAARFGPVSGGTYGEFVKVIGYGRKDFVWTGSVDRNDSVSTIGIEFDRAGVHRMQVAGRSHGHQIDRIVIHRDTIDQDQAINGRC